MNPAECAANQLPTVFVCFFLAVCPSTTHTHTLLDEAGYFLYAVLEVRSKYLVVYGRWDIGGLTECPTNSSSSSSWPYILVGSWTWVSLKPPQKKEPKHTTPPTYIYIIYIYIYIYINVWVWIMGGDHIYIYIHT